MKIAKNNSSFQRGKKRKILENYNVSAEKIEVTPTGVNLDEFKPDAEKREKIRMKYGINKDEIVLMFSGHEFRRKGLEFVIRALPLVKEEVKLLVVGRDDPTYSTYYKHLASKIGVLDKVIFAGFVSEYK